jgi:hypothetical protein
VMDGPNVVAREVVVVVVGGRWAVFGDGDGWWRHGHGVGMVEGVIVIFCI